MDFSKVRLSNFVHSSLWETTEDDALPDPAPLLGDVCASAPQYTVSLAPIPVSVPRPIKNAQIDEVSGYCLAVSEHGVAVWEHGTPNSLFFPLESGHSIDAMLVPPDQSLAAKQPGLVVLDRVSGGISYWESVNQAILATNDGADTPSARDLVSDSLCSRGAIPLKSSEQIEHLALVAPFGLVAATSEGAFYLVGLTDSLSQQRVLVTPMRSGFPLIAKLRRGGAFQQGVEAVRAAPPPSPSLSSSSSSEPSNEPSSRAVYIINRHGDLEVWHVGPRGAASLARDARVGSQLHMRMNVLYPNSAQSLEFHDIAIEGEQTCHLLASFAPYHDLRLRYFLLVSLDTSSLEISSVYRVQAFEAKEAECVRAASLYVREQVLIFTTNSSITMVDSVTRGTNPRWEESLALKTPVLSSSAPAVVACAMGLLLVRPSMEREPKSTTQARLEQAVFESSETNPLNLASWPSFSANPDAAAVDELALQIAEARTPFLPSYLPDFGAHLALRAEYLGRMFKLTEEPSVRELAQTLVAAHALYEKAQTTAQAEIDAAAHRIDAGAENLRDLLTHHVLDTPKLLDLLANESTGAGASAESASALARVVLSVLRACAMAANVGLPHWATQAQSPLRAALEMLTKEAGEHRDAELLASATELLCAFTAISGSPSGADNPTTQKLLLDLAKLEPEGHARALEIAAQYRVYSALAPIEVSEWLAQPAPRVDTSAFCGVPEGSLSFERGSIVNSLVSSFSELGVYTPAGLHTLSIANRDGDVPKAAGRNAMRLGAAVGSLSSSAEGRSALVSDPLRADAVSEVVQHIADLGDAYASAVFETCIAQGYADRMVRELGAYYSYQLEDYLDAHQLHGIAWTLAPGTPKSLEHLLAAMRGARVLDERKVYSSLAKLASSSLGDVVAEREAELGQKLVRAQESLTEQLNSTFENEDHGIALEIWRRGVAQLDSVLDLQSAVDLLALALPQPFAEVNRNFVMGFALVEADDDVRKRLLAQQLIGNTNWKPVKEANTVSLERQLRQTLFFHTLVHLPRSLQSLCCDLEAVLKPFDEESVRASYPWDISGVVVRELEDVRLRAKEIAQNYDIQPWLSWFLKSVE